MPLKRFVLPIRNSIICYKWHLLFITILYVLAYLAYPATPGNTPHAHPLGWWGWFDQGKYLLSANAFAQLDLTPEKHFYPPLYTIIGAAFIKLSSGHPFFFINLFCLLWFSFVFIRVSERYISRWSSIVLLFATTVLDQRILINYVIPWTTTLSVALLSTGFIGLLWLIELKEKEDARVNGWQIFTVALSLGLLVPTRPVDAIVGCVLGIVVFFVYWAIRRSAVDRLPRPHIFILLTFAGAAIGPAIFIGFNYASYGTFFGSYAKVASSNGFFIYDIPEKFLSLWLDGATLYAEPNAAISSKFPWIYVALAGLIWVLVKKDILLRTIAITICLLFALYMPYGDLLPNGLWRYLNIHYFKWTFPFLALFAWLLIKDILSLRRSGYSWGLPLAVLVVISSVLMCLSFSVQYAPLQVKSSPGNPIRFELPQGEIDFIDIKGLNSGFNEVYFGNHRLFVDGQELQRVRNYRLLPKGSDVRLLFIRPVTGRIVELLPDSQIVRQDTQMAAHTGTYHFTLGAPKPFRKDNAPLIVSQYRLGDTIDFSSRGNGSLYAANGWSHPEDWGCWSLNQEAHIVMQIDEALHEPKILELELGALVHPKQPCQRLSLSANGQIVSNQKLCLEDNVGQPQLYRYNLPSGPYLKKGGKLDIRIHTPDAISPTRLGLNDDKRVLGVGLKTLRVF